MGEGWCRSVNEKVWMCASAAATVGVLCGRQFGYPMDVGLVCTDRIPSNASQLVVTQLVLVGIDLGKVARYKG